MKSKLFLFVCICFLLTIALTLYINYRLNSETVDFSNPNFKHECDEIYGVGNWSEYGADWIDFEPGSYPPIYFNEKGISFTCFKTGTIP